MEIPAFFAVYEDALRLTDGYISKATPKEGTRRYEFYKTLSEVLPRDYRIPVLMIDCNSFAVREFSEKVMKHLMVRSADIWFMTYIETVEDVFDAFNKDAELVFAPYHFIQSDAELKDICDVSDSVVPVIFIHNGKALLRRGRTGDVLNVLEKLVKMGYYRNCIMDLDDSLDGYTWSIIADDYPSTIPLVNSSKGFESFQSVIVPYLL